jgi:PilZ domain
MNQRQHNRYRLAASVSFSWETEDHRVHYGNGQTRDCSISGAFVLSPERLTIGSILQMEFSLPRLLAAGPGARLKTRARVVRVEPEGFAVLAEMGPSSLLHRLPSPMAATQTVTKAKPVH